MRVRGCALHYNSLGTPARHHTPGQSAPFSGEMGALQEKGKILFSD